MTDRILDHLPEQGLGLEHTKSVDPDRVEPPGRGRGAGLWAAVRSLHSGHHETEHKAFRLLAAVVTALVALSGTAAWHMNPAEASLEDPIAAGGWQGVLEKYGPLYLLAPIPAASGPARELAAPVQPVQAASPAPPANRGALPMGKGMWMWKPELVEGGNPEATIIRAQQVGLSHIYVRTGSSRSGLHDPQYLNDLLPRAHAAGIRIYGWDFPYLEDVNADVARAVAAISYKTPDGHRIDGFTADIETRGEGVNINVQTAEAYGAGLRAAVGPAYPLIATVPRPNAALITYPFASVVANFDAIAPMVYWLNRQPDTDLAAAMQALQGFGKPILPIGQAYDGAPEGGRPGPPRRDEIQRFMKVGEETGALSVSFWSWQHANTEIWDAVRDAPQFSLPATPLGAPIGFTAGQIRQYQGLLTSLGFPVPSSGVWDPPTIDALRAYQQAGGLDITGVVDEATRRLLLTPFEVPLLARP